ncbi:MAG: 1,4-alpha-glucan branching protein GlgB, partial [Clostridiales bacterium]|nr:1,4-alpha-glucan branching protein GlgB [Clostridiales bacterium]
GVQFRVYAPHAEKIEVIGEFNDWDGKEDVMVQTGQSGIFEAVNAQARPGMMYKYRIYQEDGRVVDRFDPYGFGSELRPKTATYIVDINDYTFHDDAWMKKRTKNYNEPLNIYEVHAGSWRRNEDDENGWYQYQELAKKMVDYVKEMGYTHVEFLPLSEHPADCSWGYQVSGFFCPTSRYGTAINLMEMVDIFHQAGIGVIMDFVPVHFVVNDYALSNFDGTPLYEYPDGDTGYSEWGTCNFNYYRGEVRSMLQSAADFWLTRFHFDGIRMDAISNAIYWTGDASRGVNEGAVAFIQGMNQGLQRRHPTAMLIAEDSTNYLKVTAPVEYDGLGFDYKWDMGWMNDTLSYFKMHPADRRSRYHTFSFSMMYFYNEHYLLPLSHDEVVHGKATIVQKMWGEYDVKFQQAKTLYTYMFTRPGKKLNFMGNELGQFREWDEEKECDWDLLHYPKHDAFRKYIKELQHLYISEPAFYDGEYNSACFRWLDIEAEKERVYIYERMARGDHFVVVLNMSDEQYNAYEFGYDRNAVLHEVLSGERQEYDGYFNGSREDVSAQIRPFKSWKRKFVITIPALGAIVYKVRFLPEPTKTEEEDESAVTAEAVATKSERIWASERKREKSKKSDG